MIVAMELLAVIEVGTFTGLPAHPFLNRIAMYLVPTALLVALLALRPRWRPRLAAWAFGLSVLALVGVQLTMGAGEVMDNVIHGDANPLVEDHESWAKLLRIGLAAQILVVGLLWRTQRRSGTVPGDSEPDSVVAAGPARQGSTRAVVATSVFVAAATLVNVGLTVMTAHSGSKSVYEEDGKILIDELGQAAEAAPREAGR
jgi:hypothetical protein